jgi:hypothetical protein
LAEPGDERIPAANALQACRRKRRFETEREADDAAYRARMEGRRLGIYHCEWCGGWHLTSRRR